MNAILRYLWDNRTTALGYLQIILGVLVTSQDMLSASALKWVVLINGIVTAVLGHYNNSRIRAAAAQVVRVEKEGE